MKTHAQRRPGSQSSQPAQGSSGPMGAVQVDAKRQRAKGGDDDDDDSDGGITFEIHDNAGELRHEAHNTVWWQGDRHQQLLGFCAEDSSGYQQQGQDEKITPAGSLTRMIAGRAPIGT